MNSITCRVCQTQNATGNKFCSNCGASLKPRTHITCPNCFHRNPLHLLYCDNCGTRLERSPTSGLDPSSVRDTGGLADPKPPTEPFSLPVRKPGETGDLDPDRIPDWLRTGEDSEEDEISEAESLEFAAGDFPPLENAELDNSIIPDWLADIDSPVEEESATEESSEADVLLPEDESLIDNMLPVEEEDGDPDSLDWLADLSDIAPEEVDEPAVESETVNTAADDFLAGLDFDAVLAAEGESMPPVEEVSAGSNVQDLNLDAFEAPSEEAEGELEFDIESEARKRGWVKFGEMSEGDEVGADELDFEAEINDAVEADELIGVTAWLTEFNGEDSDSPAVELPEVPEIEVTTTSPALDETFSPLEGIDEPLLDDDLAGLETLFEESEDAAEPQDSWLSVLDDEPDPVDFGQPTEEFERPSLELPFEDIYSGEGEESDAFLDELGDPADVDLGELLDLPAEPAADPFATLYDQESPFSDEIIEDSPFSAEEDADWLDDLGEIDADEELADLEEIDQPALETEEFLSDDHDLVPAAEPAEESFSESEISEESFMQELAALRPQTTTQVDFLSFEGAPGWFHTDEDSSGEKVYKQIGGPLDGFSGVVPIALPVARLIESTPRLSTDFTADEESDEEGLALWSAVLDEGQSPNLQKTSDKQKGPKKRGRGLLRIIYLLLLIILFILFLRIYMPAIYSDIALAIQTLFDALVSLFQ